MSAVCVAEVQPRTVGKKPEHHVVVRNVERLPLPRPEADGIRGLSDGQRVGCGPSPGPGRKRGGRIGDLQRWEGRELMVSLGKGLMVLRLQASLRTGWLHVSAQGKQQPLAEDPLVDELQVNENDTRSPVSAASVLTTISSRPSASLPVDSHKAG